MTNEQLYEILGDMSENYIIEAKETTSNRNSKFTKGENKPMPKRRRKRFQKPAAAAATLFLCICITGVTALASTGKLQGYFKDIIRFDGAVIGSEYKQATDEIDIHISDSSDNLTLEVNMLTPDVPPYMTFDFIGIETYQITDRSGNILLKGEPSEMVEIASGRATITIPLDNLTNGEYTLLITEMVGSSKADQPLVMSGMWECDFVLE